MSEPELLLYRSNLLGGDFRITNFGGGNTSAKVEDEDSLTGEPVTVLWVKGSGGDLGSMKRDGFATLSPRSSAQSPPGTSSTWTRATSRPSRAGLDGGSAGRAREEASRW